MLVSYSWCGDVGFMSGLARCELLAASVNSPFEIRSSLLAACFFLLAKQNAPQMNAYAAMG
jgi:hypothetical protein